MNNENLILYLAGVLVFTIIMILITRAIFGISTITRQLKAQTELLYEIAKVQGADRATIDKIEAQAKNTELKSIGNFLSVEEKHEA